MKKKDKTSVRTPLSMRISEKFDLPTASSSSLSVEITGNSEAVIWGCRSILVYTEELIRLETKGLDILIEGKRLTCPAYGGGGIVISGHLKSISYEERQGHGNAGQT